MIKKNKQSYFGSKRIFMKWPFLTVELYELQIGNWHWFQILDFKLVRGGIIFDTYSPSCLYFTILV